MSFPCAVEPKINRLGLRDVKIKVGQAYTLEAPFVAEPTPEIKWSINATVILPKDRHDITSTGELTVFKNNDAQRSDSGVHTLTITNEKGQDTASCNVIITGMCITSSTPDSLFVYAADFIVTGRTCEYLH